MHSTNADAANNLPKSAIQRTGSRRIVMKRVARRDFSLTIIRDHCLHCSRVMIAYGIWRGKSPCHRVARIRSESELMEICVVRVVYGG